MPDVPTLTLAGGVDIPQLGYGTYQVEADVARTVVGTALDVGYRHLDTAQMYGNERQVGEAIADSGLARDEMFVTTKLDNGSHDPDDAHAAFEQSLVELDLGFVDLFLVHWPLPAVGDFVDTWRAMEEIARSGRARAVGVSNFEIHHLQRLLDEADLVPAVNQIEVHPYLAQDELRAFGAAHGIATQAWSPIARGRVLGDPVIVEVAERVGRTPAQAVLRWHLQRGDIVFPKTASRERMEENLALFDFELDEDDMAAITGLDRGERHGPHPDTFNPGA